MNGLFVIGVGIGKEGRAGERREGQGVGRKVGRQGAGLGSWGQGRKQGRRLQELLGNRSGVGWVGAGGRPGWWGWWVGEGSMREVFFCPASCLLPCLPPCLPIYYIFFFFFLPLLQIVTRPSKI